MGYKIGEHDFELDAIAKSLEGEYSILSNSAVQELRNKAESFNEEEVIGKGFKKAMTGIDKTLEALGHSKEENEKTSDFISRVLNEKEVDVDKRISTLKESRNNDLQEMQSKIDALNSTLSSNERGSVLNSFLSGKGFKEEIPKTLIESHMKGISSEMNESNISFKKNAVGVSEVYKDGELVRNSNSNTIMTSEEYFSEKFKGVLKERSEGLGTNSSQRNEGANTSVFKSREEVINHLSKNRTIRPNTKEYDEEYKKLCALITK